MRGKQKHADTGAGVTILIEEFFYYGTCLTIKGKTSSSFATCFFLLPSIEELLMRLQSRLSSIHRFGKSSGKRVSG